MGGAPLNAADEKYAECTDVYNATELQAEHGTDMRFVHAWGKWLIWDGRVWRLDDTGEALRRAVSTVARLFFRHEREKTDALGQREAFKTKHVLSDLELKTGIMPAELKDEYDQIVKRYVAGAAKAKWAKESHAHARLKAMMAICCSFEGVAVSPERLDADPFALCCQNGVVDLRTGRLRIHRREDLITKMVATSYNPDMLAPTFESFLTTSLPDAETRMFLQRFVGYTLTGDVSEHVLVFFYGSGGNGKSTLVGVLRELLGPYGVSMPRSFLFPPKGADPHPTEFANLKGARMAVCAEIPKGKALDEAKVKDLVGNDVITCRRMGEDFWEFAPTHKFFVSGNHKPKILGEDDGIWRRLRLVPWTETIAVKDKTLDKKLLLELPGVLAWAVRGCLDWQAHGLGEPAAILQATAEYREESDAFRDFLSERCKFGDYAASGGEYQVTRKALRAAYEGFQEDRGGFVGNPRDLAKALKQRGVADHKMRVGSSVQDAWKGVRLLKTDELMSVGVVVPVGGGSTLSQNVESLGKNVLDSAKGRIGPNETPTSPQLSNDDLLDLLSPPDGDLH